MATFKQIVHGSLNSQHQATNDPRVTSQTKRLISIIERFPEEDERFIAVFLQLPHEVLMLIFWHMPDDAYQLIAEKYKLNIPDKKEFFDFDLHTK